MANIIAAYTRSKNKIILGCASTGPAASNYDDFETVHSLFHIPVTKDAEDFDRENELL